MLVRCRCWVVGRWDVGDRLRRWVWGCKSRWRVEGERASPGGAVVFGVAVMSMPAVVAVAATAVMIRLSPAFVVVAATAVRWVWGRWWWCW